MNGMSEEKKTMSSFEAAHFTSRSLLGFFVYLTQFWFDSFYMVNGVMAGLNPFTLIPLLPSI